MEEERDGDTYFFLAARCSLHGRARLLPPSRGHSRVERPGKSVLFPAIASRRCVAPLKKGKKKERREKLASFAARMHRMQEEEEVGVISIARNSRAL